MSAVYESDPLYVTDQPPFLNAVIAGSTGFPPYRVLREALGIEERMGRQRTLPKGPRNIDIDLLLYDEMVIRAGDLMVPHPGLTERAFVIVPLTELEPAVREPMSGALLSQWLGAVSDQQLRKLGTGGAE
jgi:2-amino-4-hydroxy-6-hydroxymethyldihydropteridine diphosphokinase